MSNIELVDTDTGEKFYPKLPGNGKLDLNPRGSFDIVAGDTLSIQLDIDANKSIHIVGNGKNKYQFRPVVFIDIVTDTFNERYVQLHGDIAAIDHTDNSFNLCNTDIPLRTGDNIADTISNACLRVETGDAPAIFGIDGKPALFTDLVNGQPATVLGRLQRDVVVDDNSAAEANVNTGNDDRKLDDLVLKASLIELGELNAFQKLNGTAQSAVDVNDQFIMDVAAGQGYLIPYALNVQLQTGTMLINRKGAPVASSVIGTGQLVSVRGVVDGVSDTLYASVIVIDTDITTKLSGDIGINPDNTCGFALIGTAEGDISVATDADTKAFKVNDGASDPIDISELTAPLMADVYGTLNGISGCFDADTIIVYESAPAI